MFEEEGEGGEVSMCLFPSIFLSFFCFNVLVFLSAWSALLKFQYCVCVSSVHIGDSAVNHFSFNGANPSNFPPFRLIFVDK